jgi:2-polyprenyl-3-methyl-5-hydroxy-6-metoxy-1,4-benzoquinol methylase
MIGWLKKAYRRYVPMSVRQSRIVDWPKRTLLRLLPHDAVYDADYYTTVIENDAAGGAKVMAASIRREFAPRTVVDLGCGTGALLEALQAEGLQVLGLENSAAALDICRARGLRVRKMNVESDVLEIGETFDLAVSMEVAEHLPATVADRYVNFLTSLSDVVVFTGAPPGQGGTDHVNEQPQAYWVAKFVARSFLHLEDVSAQWRDEWKAGGVASWYYRNVMVFRKRMT